MIPSLVLSLAFTVSAFINFILLKIVLAAIKAHNESPDTKESTNGQAVTVAFHEDHAYWIDDGKLRTAPADEEHNVLMSMARDVDTMSMESDELRTIGQIVDAIKESE